MLLKMLKSKKVDNKGATMVTVLVAVSFLAVLGAILLFTAFTGFRLKAAQAIGDNRFYDAETAMNEVRAGLQGFVTDTIQSSYARLMFEYDGNLNIENDFMQRFSYDLLSPSSTPSPAPLFVLAPATVDGLFATPSTTPGDPPPAEGYTGGLSFDLNCLRLFITDDTRTELTAPMYPGDDIIQIIPRDVKGRWVNFAPESRPPAPPVSPDWRYIIEAITLRGLRIVHTSDEDYTSIVDTDITFTIPNLGFDDSGFTLRELGAFAFIATDTMTNTGSSNITIKGSAYVGNANLNSTDGKTTIRDGILISGGGTFPGNYSLTGPLPGTAPDNNGDVRVSNNHTLTVKSSAFLWANNIRVGTNNTSGTVNLLGSTYAAANLQLEGSSATPSTARLRGSYFGFGDSADSAAQSSSIIVNSRNNTLNLSGDIADELPAGVLDVDPNTGEVVEKVDDDLKYLFVAGRSFISALSGDTQVDILTGQSLAVRSDQLAYLIPPELIEGMSTNPMVVTEEQAQEIMTRADSGVLFDDELWIINGNRMTLAHYINRNTEPKTIPFVYDAPRGVQHILTQPIGGGASGQRLLYVFMKFTDFTNVDGVNFTAAEAANRYFMAYFQNNTDAIRNFAQVYMSDFHADNSAIVGVRTSGNVYTGRLQGDPTGLRLLEASFSGGNNTVARLTGEYTNRRTYLRRTPLPLDIGHTVHTPYDFVVRGKWNSATSSFDPPPPGIYEYEHEGVPIPAAFVFDGRTMGAVNGSNISLHDIWTYVNSNSRYSYATIDAFKEDLKIVICYSENPITVDISDFTGLVIVRGNVNVTGSYIQAGEEKLRYAVRGKNIGDVNSAYADEELKDYLNVDLRDDSSDDEGRNLWDLTNLVYYDNWRKG